MSPSCVKSVLLPVLMENETLRPVEKGIGPDDGFTEFANARGLLITRIGEYCSFCEMHCDHDLAVEHKLPKNYQHNKHLELEWTNFLLACRNCNSTKGTKDIKLNELMWPDTNNTFYAFVYGPDAMIRVNPALNDGQKLMARSLLELVGVSRKLEMDSRLRVDPKLKDRRWMNREEAWRLAVDAYSDLQTSDTVSLRKYIIRLAQAKGFWSVWMTVFASDKQMAAELIRGFPGTSTSCFDADCRVLNSPER